jgi:hypothetical protein
MLAPMKYLAPRLSRNADVLSKAFKIAAPRSGTVISSNALRKSASLRLLACEVKSRLLIPEQNDSIFNRRGHISKRSEPSIIRLDWINLFV